MLLTRIHSLTTRLIAPPDRREVRHIHCLTSICAHFKQANDLANGLRVGLAYIDEYNNGFQPINRLPPEALSMVFLELKLNYTYCDIPPGYAEHYECLHIFSVCRYWRTVALGCSELWTCVFLSPEAIDIAELFCHRSAQRRISLVVRDFDESKCPLRMWDLIKASSGRIAKLAAIDCRMPKLSEVRGFPAMVTLINRGSDIGPRTEPQAQQILLQNGLKHTCLCIGLTIAGNLRVLPKLISLRLDLSPLKSPDHIASLRTEVITNLLDAQPLLQELIFECIPSLFRADPEIIRPRSLVSLKRLAFYRSDSNSICTILSLIKHSPTISIFIDQMSQWDVGTEMTEISEFFARTIPNARPGYTCLHVYVNLDTRKFDIAGQPVMFYYLLYAIDLILTGPGATYRFSATVALETKNNILTCIADSRRLESLKTIWTPSPADVLVPQIYSWLPSVPQLATLTLVWSSILWMELNSVPMLFSALPNKLVNLILQVDPFPDDDLASSNFDNLITLNNRRAQPLNIRLCFRVDAERRTRILTRYPCLTQSDRIETMPSSDPGSRSGAACEVPSGVDIVSTRHDYWPSWTIWQEALQCRVEREAYSMEN